jgi:hypothetical protein
LSNGTVTITGSGSTASISSVGNGWYRCSISATSTGTTARPGIGLASDGTTTPSGFQSYLGDGTSGIFIWGAQLETGSTATAYQRTTTAFDVTEAGVQSLSYLSFDGVDDHMTTTVDTNTIFGVSGADPGYMIVGGVKYNTAGGAQVPWARLGFCGDNAGYFGMWAHTSNGGEAGLYQWDTGSKTAERPYTVGSAAVFTGRRNPLEGAAGKLYASVNGVSSAGTDAAALINISSTLLVGRQFGNTFLNGNIYSLIARGALTNAPTITNTETWVAGKTGVTL